MELPGPLQETSRAGKVWPNHRADQHKEHETSSGTAATTPDLFFMKISKNRVSDCFLVFFYLGNANGEYQLIKPFALN